ncbi:MAG: transcriptional regulator [Cyclobacteriaceae bacterium]|nr:MAG: transcriptional regulator [Cyclobacteriaceae bacterium]
MPNQLNKIFKSIADPTRRDIFHLLIVASTALSITQIANHFDISRQGITKHLKVLHQAGLLEMTTKGRERYCMANAGPLREIHDWVAFYEQFWDDKLNRLNQYLKQKGKQNPGG